MEELETAWEWKRRLRRRDFGPVEMLKESILSSSLPWSNHVTYFLPIELCFSDYFKVGKDASSTVFELSMILWLYLQYARKLTCGSCDPLVGSLDRSADRRSNRRAWLAHVCVWNKTLWGRRLLQGNTMMIHSSIWTCYFSVLVLSTSVWRLWLAQSNSKSMFGSVCVCVHMCVCSDQIIKYNLNITRCLHKMVWCLKKDLSRKDVCG